MVVVSLLAGAAFGLALAAPPGPMNAVIAEESVLRGWRAGFLAGLGAAVADLLFFALSWVGVVAVVERSELLRGAMVAVGGCLMLYFAFEAARGARASFTPVDAPGESRGFRKALVLGLSNPYQILFWLTVGVGLLTPGTLDVLAAVPVAGDPLSGAIVVETGSPALIVGLFCGVAAWIVAYPAGLVAAGDRIDRFAPAVAGLSAVVLAGFGLYFLFDAAGTLF